ncbi:MAG: hypothetical protein IT378_13505 [Sandaracinaceae bacterium]|nr:hypothetical protein [Sandaracinaceae bacterium]MCC6875317.1 hypothetical protein [Sandaracinaceae bacterium]
MSAAVFRGTGAARSIVRLLAVAVAYVGTFAVLWGLGLVVRGWQGWALLLVPLATLVAIRVFAWQRVAVEVAGGVVRYTGATPARDWDVPVAEVSQIYLDASLESHPVVLVRKDGHEHICGELGPDAGRALHDHLIGLGIASPRRARAGAQVTPPPSTGP